MWNEIKYLISWKDNNADDYNDNEYVEIKVNSVDDHLLL